MPEQGYDYYALQLLASANLLTVYNFSDVTMGRAQLEKKIYKGICTPERNKALSRESSFQKC